MRGCRIFGLYYSITMYFNLNQVYEAKYNGAFLMLIGGRQLYGGALR